MLKPKLDAVPETEGLYGAPDATDQGPNGDSCQVLHCRSQGCPALLAVLWYWAARVPPRTLHSLRIAESREPARRTRCTFKAESHSHVEDWPFHEARIEKPTWYLTIFDLPTLFK